MTKWFAETRVIAFGLMLFSLGFGLGMQYTGRLAKTKIGILETTPWWITHVKRVSLALLLVAIVCGVIILYDEYQRGNIELPSDL